MDTQGKHLYYLNELSDYKVEDSYADVRGWEVKDAALRRVGTVKNLLVDKKTERVVYLDVEVDSTIIDAEHDPYAADDNSGIREFINEKGENHIIIPIGLIDINMAKEYVFTGNIDHNTFASTKRIRPNTPIARDYEHVILDSYGRKYDQRPITRSPDEDDDDLTIDEEERMDDIKKRRGIAEYRDSSSDTEDDADWFDAENERMEGRDEETLDEEDYFYGKKEFDDSRFYRGKK
ncbi:MAG TPA: PRC-barrel domain-containing protein [Pricia sp.]|nr:PRC-barrel domain-containing protein [Pricia sp.]